jgi:hypothetical protein
MVGGEASNWTSESEDALQFIGCNWSGWMTRFLLVYLSTALAHCPCPDFSWHDMRTCPYDMDIGHFQWNMSSSFFFMTNGHVIDKMSWHWHNYGMHDIHTFSTQADENSTTYHVPQLNHHVWELIILKLEMKPNKTFQQKKTKFRWLTMAINSKLQLNYIVFSSQL